MRRFYVLNLNPEPWAIGTIQHGRLTARMSPNLNLVAYQQAVKEALADEEMPPDEYRKFTFYFWRQQARYIDTGDKIRQRNQADATNMQKALEDSLQGILFKNDRDVREIRSVIVRQGADVKPGIVIKAEKIYEDEYAVSVTQEIPSKYLALLTLPSHVKPTEDKWAGGETIF